MSPAIPIHPPSRSAALDYPARRALDRVLTLIDRPEIRDIFIHAAPPFADPNAPAAVWIEHDRALERLEPTVLGERHPRNDELRAFAVAVIAAGQRQLDELHPCQDVSLGDGIRIHAALPPVAVHGPAISIRLPAPKRLGLDNLEAEGMCTPQQRDTLEKLVRSRKNLLITGGTGSGKTTLLNALLECVDPHERIITIEDVAELRPNHPHCIALESRTANSEGAGDISLDHLLRQALRMRPDRLVLGECRGAEIATLLTALNTGHDGGAGTLHASAIDDTAGRLEALGALAGMTPVALAKQVISALDLIVHVERRHGRFSLAGFGRPELNQRGELSVREVVPAPILRREAA